MRGWLIWGCGAAFFAYAFIHRVAPSVMFDRLMADFAADATRLGQLSACYFYAYAAIQIPVGLLLDRFGPRRMLTLSAVGCMAGSLAFALAEHRPVAYAARLLIGAGSGVAFLGTLKLAADWLPPARFALAIGLTQAVAMLGAVAGQAPLALAVESFGWRVLMVGAAVLGLVVGGLIWWATRHPAPAPQATASSGGGHWRAALANPQTWFAAAYSGLSSSPMLAFAVLWGVAYLVQAEGMARAQAAAGASMVFIGWAVSAPLLGWLSDRIGRRKPPMVAGAAGALAGWLLLLYGPDLPWPAQFALLAWIGGTSSAMALSFAVGREANPARVSGMVTGIVNFASIAAGAALQPLIGALLDRRWDGTLVDGARVFDAAAYGEAFLAFPIASGLCLVVTLFIRETHCRPPA
jgi:MFS family permease